MKNNELPKVITKNQAIGYAVVAYHTLKASPNEITEKELASEILTIMRLYKQDEIVEKANTEKWSFYIYNKRR